MEGISSDQISVNYPDIRLEELSKTLKPASQNSRCPGRESNQGLSESKSETLMLQPSCFFIHFILSALKMD
jgi:hypothetical protein